MRAPRRSAPMPAYRNLNAVGALSGVVEEGGIREDAHFESVGARHESAMRRMWIVFLTTSARRGAGWVGLGVRDPPSLKACLEQSRRRAHLENARVCA
jgi:hypothetical protein